MKQIISSVTSSVVLYALFSVPTNAAVVDFESLSDAEIVSTQFAGVKFENATAFIAGVSLDAEEFPPYSGNVVLVETGGPMTIRFETLMSSVSAFLNYAVPVTFSAYDSAANLIATDVSEFNINTGRSGVDGSSTNELFNVTSSVGISHVVVQGDPAGYSFTLDDLTYKPVVTTPPPATVPEPGVALLLLTGLAAVSSVSKCRRIKK